MTQKILIAIGFILLFSSSPAFAQAGGTYGRRNLPVSESPCWTKPYLEATPEQLKALDDLQCSFYKELLALHSQQINIRYELRFMLDNPKPESRTILAKQKHFSSIQTKMDEISIQYFLKARSLFTPEQLSRLPSSCKLGFSYGSGMNRSPMKGRGKR